MREVTGIPENLSSDYSLKAIFDSNKCYHLANFKLCEQIPEAHCCQKSGPWGPPHCYKQLNDKDFGF